MDLSLDSRTALVTGAARGIGARIAAQFAEHGCYVYLGDVDEPAAHVLAGELGQRAVAARMDVRDRAQVRALVERMVRERGGIDILVNNAGLLAAGSFEQTTDTAWDDLVAVNLTGVFNCVQAAVPVMRGRSGASIINISSVSAEKGGGSLGNVWYAATKAGVIAITKGLARDLGPAGIRVNAIAPAIIETDMVRSRSTELMREAMLARFPLGRFASTDDVAQLAVFLASGAAGFITGETIVVDGGYLRT
jgi:NAD(P)-dependent dehydrogenase (short-subunit alcohol dehydrogenase family)